MAEHAIIVSSSGFSKDAYLVADTAGVDLMEIEDLRARISGKELPINQPDTSVDEIPPPHKQKTAFIIMPFKDEYRDTYMLGIRETLAKDGYSCIRADEVEFNGRIMDQILDLIKTSELIIAEVTEHNPNVYYELGISHALGKNVVLCTKDVAEIPFDTSDLNHIVYTDIVDLREKLSARLESIVIPL